MNRYVLIKSGIAYNEGLRRFSNNKETYDEFLTGFCDDENFVKLEKALDSNDVKEAFHYAHALKGITGNLSIKLLHEALVPFVDALRDEDIDKARIMFEPVKINYERTVEILQTAK